MGLLICSSANQSIAVDIFPFDAQSNESTSVRPTQLLGTDDVEKAIPNAAPPAPMFRFTIEFDVATVFESVGTLLFNLQGNFLDYKQDEGWEIIYVPKDSAFVDDGKKLLHKGKTASITARVEAVMRAQKLSGTDVASLLQRERTRSGLTQEEHDALARAAFVAFYRKQPTREALRFELEMRPREKILTFCEVTELSKASSVTQCLSEKGVQGTFASKHKQVRLLREIFFTTPVYDWLSFDAEVQYCKDDLDLFAEYVSRNKDQIEEELGVKIRKDLFKMPTKQLAVFLEMVNLDHYQSCCKVKNKNKLYYYKIDANRILMNIAVRDRRKRVTCEFHELELRKI